MSPRPLHHPLYRPLYHPRRLSLMHGALRAAQLTPNYLRVLSLCPTHSVPPFGATTRGLITLHFTGPPVPITARMCSTPQRPSPFSHPVSCSPPSLRPGG
eukprot:1176789-Prorocentrum_minimum.AAC.2